MSEIPRLGFGTWAHGGNAYGPVPESDAADSIFLALENGVRFFDTADIYGDGRAETILGRCAGKYPGAIIATKTGYIKEGSRDQDFSARHLSQAVLRSSARLGRSPLDILLLHSPPREILQNGVVADHMNRLQDCGAIQSWGVSLRGVEDFGAAVDLAGCRVIEVIFNLLDQRPIDKGILDQAGRLGIKVVARVPLCFGFLSQKYSTGHKFHGPDQRARWPQNQIDKWIDAAKKFQFLENDQRSMPQAALSFCLFPPQVSFVIPGMKTPLQVSHNVNVLKSSAAELTQPEFDRARHVWSKLGNIIPP